MLKKVVLSLFIIFISCNERNNKNKDTTDKYINFNKYTFNTTNGNQDKISLSKDKKYILDFWYLECAPCVKQHKKIKEYQSQLSKINVEVIGVSIDKSKKRWVQYLNEHQYTWKNYNQFRGDVNLKNDLDIKIFPTYFIVDDKGNIEKKFNAFSKVIAHLKIE